jgi:glycosyltransferase involved in cell wall biosynthesis
MSCGLPALLSDIPPHREILEKASPSSGKLFPAGDAEALSSLLKSFSSHTFNSTILRQTAIESFSTKIMSTGYQSLYEKILMGN